MKIVKVFAENSVFEQEGWMHESSDRSLTSFKRRLQRRFYVDDVQLSFFLCSGTSLV